MDNPIRSLLAVRQGDSFRKLISELVALKYTPWYRWHPQIAMRYLPVVERIKKGRPTKARKLAFRRADPISILEIGSGGLGIAPYLKRPAVGVDVNFEPPFHPLLKRVKGEATNLKFGDDSFDVVVSMDMLEHLPQNRRQTAVAEMLRVGKSLVVIGVPCGQEAGGHDKRMRMRLPRPAVSRNSGARNDGTLDRGFEFLEEQVKYGLPNESDILYYIKAAARRLKKDVRIEIKGNMNIKLREFLMKGWMSENILVNILFRKVFLLLIPIFRLIDRPPYYRKIFLVEVTRNK